METATTGLADSWRSKDGGVRRSAVVRPLGRGRPVPGRSIASPGSSEVSREGLRREDSRELARPSPAVEPACSWCGFRPGVGFLPSCPRAAAPAFRDVCCHHWVLDWLTSIPRLTAGCSPVVAPTRVCGWQPLRPPLVYLGRIYLYSSPHGCVVTGLPEAPYRFGPLVVRSVWCPWSVDLEIWPDRMWVGSVHGARPLASFAACVRPPPPPNFRELGEQLVPVCPSPDSSPKGVNLGFPSVSAEFSVVVFQN